MVLLMALAVVFACGCTKSDDLTNGDGLGLPICKQMAMKMNGDLDISPDFTKGTRFIVSLKA